MPKTTKYLVAANGTYHLRNVDTGNSYCGRVKPDMEDVKATSREPRDFPQNCGRCAQLAAKVQVADSLPKAQKAATPATGTPKARKTAQKPVQAVGQSFAKEAGVPDPADVYGPLVDWLAANGTGSRVQTNAAGSHLVFDAVGYTYMVWAPAWNANGAADGWVIGYTADPAAGDDTYVEDDMRTDTAVAKWLTNDLGFIKAFKPVRKTAAKPVGASKRAPRDLLLNDLMRIMHHADHAYVVVREAGLAKEIVDAYKAMKKAASDLHKVVDTATK